MLNTLATIVISTRSGLLQNSEGRADSNNWNKKHQDCQGPGWALMSMVWSQLIGDQDEHIN
jgi:hypothetical protein